MEVVAVVMAGNGSLAFGGKVGIFPAIFLIAEQLLALFY